MPLIPIYKLGLAGLPKEMTIEVGKLSPISPGFKGLFTTVEVVNIGPEKIPEGSNSVIDERFKSHSSKLSRVSQYGIVNAH